MTSSPWNVAAGPLKPGGSESYKEFASPRGTFSGEVPADWPGFDEATPFGSSAHFLGPVEENGAFRAALHVHFLEKGRPGFLALEEWVKRERRSDKLTDREATPISRWKVARSQARRFEITETRWPPGGLLPARPIVLHHYYAVVPGGDGYFVLKLSSSRKSYLGHRERFERLLGSFRILGYP